MAVELTRLMRACLHPLMPAAISRMTEGYDPSCGKSPDTCRGKLYFDTTPLGLKMSVSALRGRNCGLYLAQTVKRRSYKVLKEL